jgi:hypothetical protein
MNTINTRIILRNDSTANWLDNDSVVLLRGEVGIEFLTDGSVKMKVGNGTSTWAELPYFGGNSEGASTHQVFEAEIVDNETDSAAIIRVVGNATPVIGDIAIVKKLIVDDKYSYTAYVYNGAGWAAMSGNYNAKNIYFDENFLFTYQFGRHTPGASGSYELPVADDKMNLFELLSDSFALEQNPVTTDPSVSLTLTGSGAYEVGTEVTPSFTATFEDGKYTYGPEPTGATVTAWEVTTTAGETFDAAVGTCATVVVTDSTKFGVTANATHTAGNVPVTNKNKPYPDGQIAAGTKSKSISSGITGYRSFFYGVLDTSSADAPLTSQIIRDQLTNGGNYNASKTFTLNGSPTAKRIVIAIPTNNTRGGLKEVILTSAMNTPITDLYVKTTSAVQVEGVNGATAVDYTTYIYEPSVIDSGEVHKITLA